MALMLIIAGACLALGGLLGLLSGFDAMTTERGAAATIAGVTALAGGLISIGLGCVVARLSQILAAYEDDSEERIAAALNEEAAKTSTPSPVIVPVPQPDVELIPEIEPAPVKNVQVEPARLEPASNVSMPVETDTLLRNPLNQRRDAETVEAEVKSKQSTTSRLLSRLGRNKGALATGAAAGAALAGTAAAIASSKQPAATDANPAEEPTIPDPQVSVVDADPVPSEIGTSIESTTSSELALRSEHMSESERLEIELANALKEDLEGAPPTNIEVEAPADPVPSPKPARGRRKFSEMLEAKPAPPVEITEIAAETADVPASMPKEPETSAEEIVAVSDTESASTESEPEASGDEPDTVASRSSEETDELVGKSAEEVDGTDPVSPEGPAVLGRYVRDGHTYTLYADGSVDALTEAGVKRYASMEELRRELTKA